MNFPRNIRPLDVTYRNISNDREREGMRDIVRDGQLQEALKNMGAPVNIAEGVTAQLRALRESSELDDLPQSKEDMVRQARESLAYEHAGKFIQYGPAAPGQFVMWDFEDILSEAQTVHLALNGRVVVEYFDGGGTSIPEGEPAQAFLRYMRFVGIFEGIEARKPCACVDGIGCDRCGGLGWTVGGTE